MSLAPALSRSDQSAVQRLRVTTSKEFVLDLEEIPNPYRNDARNPTYFRIAFGSTESDKDACLALCRTVAKCLNRQPPLMRAHVTGGTTNRITIPSALERVVRANSICVLQPEDAENLHIYFIPRGGYCPYAKSKRFVLDTQSLGAIMRIQPL